MKKNYSLFLTFVFPEKRRKGERKRKGGKKRYVTNLETRLIRRRRVSDSFFPLPLFRRLALIESTIERTRLAKLLLTNIYTGPMTQMATSNRWKRNRGERGRIRNTWNREVNRTTRTFVSVRKGQRIAEGRRRWWWWKRAKNIDHLPDEPSSLDFIESIKHTVPYVVLIALTFFLFYHRTRRGRKKSISRIFRNETKMKEEEEEEEEE